MSIILKIFEKLLNETNIAKSSENIQVNDEILILVSSLDLNLLTYFVLLGIAEVKA